MNKFIKYGLLLCLVVQIFGCVSTSKNPSPGIVEPRKNHYIFAHYSLPLLVFTRTDKAIEELENNRKTFLEYTWMAVSSELSKKGLPVLDYNGLTSYKENINGINMYIVKLPEPIGMTEAYYTIIAVKDNIPRYFTLELTAQGFCDNRESPTVFGEWTKNHEHLNYGCGPIPDKDKFLERVVKQL